MRTRTSIHAILAGSIAVAGLALGGCTREDPAATQAGAEAQAGAQAAASQAPPPTFAAQFEQRLLDMGATRGDQGLVLVLGQPVADASKGKSGQAGQPAAATAAQAHIDVVDRIADLLEERPELQVEIHGDSAGAVAALLRQRRFEIDAERIRTGDGTDRGPLQFVLANSEGRFDSRVAGAGANGGEVGRGGGTGWAGDPSGGS